MIQPSVVQPAVAALSAGLVAFTVTAGHAADLSFVTSEGLFRIEPSGDNRQILLPAGDSPINALLWSQDGRRLAVVQNYSDVYRRDPGAATPKLVFSSDCPVSPDLDLAWQPNSTVLVIKQRCPSATSTTPAEFTLFLSTAAGELTPLATRPETQASDVESDFFLAPDGSRVAYVANQHIFVADLDGSSPRRLTHTPGIYGAAGSPLAWSPDGTRLAFYEGSYPFQRLNVMMADGGDRRLLTPDPDFQIYRSRLLWSPDGRYIAFYQPHNAPFSNQEVIALVNVNTGETQTLTRPGFYDALSWSPNSQQIALASGLPAGPQTLFQLDLVSKKFIALTNQPLKSVLDSQWSPDGAWIAFTATPPDDALGTQVLYRVSPDATQLAPLTSPDEYVYPFVWVPLAPGSQGLSITP